MTDKEKSTLVAWATKQFKAGLLSMLADGTTHHVFDFTGTVDGRPEPCFFFVAIAPKRKLKMFEHMFRGPDVNTEHRTPPPPPLPVGVMTSRAVASVTASMRGKNINQ